MEISGDTICVGSKNGKAHQLRTIQIKSKITERRKP
jgi:hypothetical protein